MAEVIIFPKYQQRQLSSEDFIATAKRILAEKKCPVPKSAPKVHVAALVEIFPHLVSLRGRA